MTNRIVFLVVAAGLSSSIVTAQTTRPQTSANEGKIGEQSPPSGFLAGPTVQAADTGDVDSRFGGGGPRRNRVSVPVRQWFALLRKLDLDEDQAAEIRELVQSFQKAAREHQQANGQRLRDLQGQASEIRGAGRDVPPEMRRELGQLRSLAPKPATYQEKIWSLLTETQQQTMHTELAQTRQRIRQRRATQSMSDARTQTDRDDRAQRRLRFLRSRQSPQIGPGDPKN